MIKHAGMFKSATTTLTQRSLTVKPVHCKSEGLLRYRKDDSSMLDWFVLALTRVLLDDLVDM